MAGEKVEAAKPAAAATGGVSSESKLWAAIGYPIWILPIVVLITEEKKKDKWLLFHAYQALILGVALWAIVAVTSVALIGCLLAPLAFLIECYFGYRAYQVERFLLPVVGEFAEKQMPK